jgi:prophage regulatory protein
MPFARSLEDAPGSGATQTSTSAALSLREVVLLTGLSRAYLYVLMARRDFPLPAKVGRRSIWKRAEIEQWLEARFAERGSSCCDGSA